MFGWSLSNSLSELAVIVGFISLVDHLDLVLNGVMEIDGSVFVFDR